MKKISNSIEEIMSVLAEENFHDYETEFFGVWDTAYDEVFGAFGNILYKEAQFNEGTTRSFYTEDVNDYFSNELLHIKINYGIIMAKDKIYARQIFISAVSVLNTDDDIHGDTPTYCLLLSLIKEDNIDKFKQLINHYKNSIQEQIICVDNECPLFGYWMINFKHNIIDDTMFHFGTIGFLDIDIMDYISIEDYSDIFEIIDIATSISIDPDLVHHMLMTYKHYYRNLVTYDNIDNFYYFDKIKCHETFDIDFLI